MSQKLLAVTYIRNNKRRIAVPIISLCLCFVLTYLTGFMLSATEATFSSVYLDNAEKIQFIDLSDKALGVTTNLDPDFYEQSLEERNRVTGDLAKKLEDHDGIRQTYTAVLMGATISAIIGGVNYFIPLVEKEEVSGLLESFGTSVIEGRLPERPGEILLDRATMNNKHVQLNDYFDYDSFRDRYTIVGVLDSAWYFGCGIPAEGEINLKSIVVFSGLHDLTAELEEEQIVLGSMDAVYDYEYGKKNMKSNVTDAIGNSTKVIYGGILVILTVLLIVVCSMYLRERHNEWCLYCSIGFSRKSLYFCIMRELLFTFLTALLTGAVVIVISVLVLKGLMIDPYGLRCCYLDGVSLFRILCANVFLIGILQIPVRYALVRIRTVDAIEDDLY